MRINNFSATVECPSNWIEGRYSAFAGASTLRVNGAVISDGEFTVNDGDEIAVYTPCNVLSGVAQDVVRTGEKYLFTLVDASYDGAFHGVGGDFDGFVWNPSLSPKTPVQTSLLGIKTWGGYRRFREELAAKAAEVSVSSRRHLDTAAIGTWNGVPTSAAARCAADFRANRSLSLSERDFERPAHAI